MFDIPPGETFWSVFEKEREKYLAENVEELKKERNFANKLQLEVGPASTTSTIVNNNNNKQQKIIERSRSTSTNSMLNVILNHHHHVCNIESPLSSTTSSINHSPLSASSNHSTNNN
jgi:hypothetical protein